MKTYILCFIILMFVANVLASCGKRNTNSQPVIPDPFIPIEDQVRYCTLDMMISKNTPINIVEQNVDIFMRILIGFGQYDPEYLYYENKVEIDFDDGAGWIDVSESVLKYLRTGNFDSLPCHAYKLSGEYRARARVTFWDGEVYESRPFEITVLPPEDGDGA